jgi:hypothetical protein
MSDRERSARRITESEVEDLVERSSPRTPVIYEIVSRLGQEEMARPVTSLWWSGLAAGLSISFSLLAQAVLQSYVPDAPWATSRHEPRIVSWFHNGGAFSTTTVHGNDDYRCLAGHVGFHAAQSLANEPHVADRACCKSPRHALRCNIQHIHSGAHKLLAEA